MSPDRLAISYQVPIIDIAYAVDEVTRLAGLGACSVHLPNFPSEPGLPDYHEPTYDPLWAVLSETGIAISHHLGTAPHLFTCFNCDPTPQAGIFTSLPELSLAEVMAWWILTGTLERFPQSQSRLVEPGLYWVPGFLASLDRKAAGPYDFPGMKRKPSEYFAQNMAITFQDDEFGLQSRHAIGIETSCGQRTFRIPPRPGRIHKTWSAGNSRTSQRTSVSSSARGTPPGSTASDIGCGAHTAKAKH